MAFPTGWTYKAKLTIDQTKVPGDLTNFPVLLTEANFPSDMLDADGGIGAQNGGGDLRFSSDSAGATQLACEVVSFATNNNPALATAEVWVKVASVSGSVDTDIYVWWIPGGSDSQPAASDTYGSQNVWDSNYRGVWHLNESAGASRVDSTANGNTLDDHNTVGTGTGKVGASGADFEAGSSHYLTHADNASLGPTGDITLEMWIKPESLPSSSGSAIIMSKTLSAGDQRSYNLYFEDTGSAVLNFYLAEDGLSDSAQLTAVHGIGTGTWKHLVAAWLQSSGLGQMYVNAASIGTLDMSSIASIYNSTSPFTLGQGGNVSAGLYFDGMLDEVRLSSTRRSADWITTSYNNQNDPATFVTEGAATAVGGAAATSEFLKMF